MKKNPKANSDYNSENEINDKMTSLIAVMNAKTAKGIIICVL